MRLHVAAAILAIAAGCFFQISAAEWIAVSLCIGLVMSLECLNTAVERLADRMSPEEHPLIRQAKDAAAAAVLLAAITAAVVGCLVFLPKLWVWIRVAG
jgi:diacylglycerol kinase